jgi:hypothetical protein
MKYKKQHSSEPSSPFGNSSSSMLYEVMGDQSVAAAFVSKIFELKSTGPCSVYRDKRIGDAIFFRSITAYFQTSRRNNLPLTDKIANL